jgi:hypothetical protein
VDWTTITHPCTNGQVEHANGLIMQGLMPCILTQEGEDVHTRFSTRARKWGAKAPLVLWSLWTTPNISTNLTPFFMVYEAEVVLLTELQYGSPRVQAYQPIKVEQALQDTIDLLEESRDIAVTRSAGYQQTI